MNIELGLSELMKTWSHEHIFVVNIPDNICASLASFHTHRKDQKKVDKLTAMIPYHEGRKNDAEVAKIKDQVETIWQKTRDAADNI